jgi:hypothetical protein
MSRTLRVTLLVLFGSALCGGVAQGRPTLHQVAVAQTPAAADGAHFALWLQKDGRVAVLDTDTGQIRRSVIVCPRPPDPARGVRPAAASGVGVVSCGDDLPEEPAQHFLVDLATARTRPLALPVAIGAVNGIGRYWIYGGGVDARDSGSGTFYISRSTGQTRFFRYDASGVGQLPPNPDTPDLAPFAVNAGAQRLLLSGAAFDGITGRNLVIRDPRLRQNTIVRSDCHQFCGPAFGSVKRLTYVNYGRYQLPSVKLVRKATPTQTWPLQPGSVIDDHGTQAPTYVALTRNALVTSNLESHGWRIRVAPA